MVVRAKTNVTLVSLNRLLEDGNTYDDLPDATVKDLLASDLVEIVEEDKSKAKARASAKTEGVEHGTNN